MSRYPRAVRDARVKCIPCNAPAVDTTEGVHVCVECGERPVNRRRTPVTVVEEDGVRIRKARATDDATDPVVTVSIESRYRDRVAVRVRDVDPGGDADGVSIEREPDTGEWVRTNGSLVYNGFLEPGTVDETEIRLAGVDARSAFIDHPPTIEAVTPVDPEDGESGVPNWRGGSDHAGSGARAATSNEPGASQPIAANGSGLTDMGETSPGAPTIEPASGSVAPVLPRPPEPRPAIEPRPKSYLIPPESEVVPMISVVLPTMNEEEGIGQCIEAIEAALSALEVRGEVIVSDSSTDRTPDIARSYGAHVITPDREGYGAAYQHGFEHARGEYVVMGDADTTYDFEELPRLFERVEYGGADLVLGSRFAGEIKPGAMPWLHRRIGNPLLTKFLNTFYEADVTDAHSGFRVIRRDALEQLDLRSDGMEFASEMVMVAGEHGLAIDEVPITYHPRVGEAKLESLSDGWRHVKFMLTNTPTYVFSMPAIALTAVGLLTMGLSLVGVRAFGILFGTHAMIAGSLLTIIGYQVGSLGVFSAVAGTAIRNPSDPVTAWIKDHFALEHGATLGVVLYGIGAAYVALMAIRWVSSGYTSLPFVNWNMVAFTLIVIGVQTVFYSFFLSLLGQHSE